MKNVFTVGNVTPFPMKWAHNSCAGIDSDDGKEILICELCQEDNFSQVSNIVAASSSFRCVSTHPSRILRQ
ncbi:hypothetical protein J437_LFUL010772 [Ladona fulva]|uniref:Uncharacterized protein n=1 Tax=Ladona fulva TaxID=123851 RepID=A0A8K0K637_LADFU|nr:hypothetical protein J437_LFUL010772 [Ladona fulva]